MLLWRLCLLPLHAPRTIRCPCMPLSAPCIYNKMSLVLLVPIGNRVGVRGVASLLEVLQVQQVSSPSPMTSDPWSPDKLELCGTGLLRVTLQV